MEIFIFGDDGIFGIINDLTVDGDGNIRNLSGKIHDIDPSSITPVSIEKLRAIDPASLPLVVGSPRIGPCVAKSGKFMCLSGCLMELYRSYNTKLFMMK